MKSGNKAVSMGAFLCTGVGALFTFLGLWMFVNFDNIKDDIEGSGDPILMPIIFTALGAIVLVAGVWLFISMLQANRKNKRLVEAGNYVIADVVDAYDDTSVSINGQCPARLVLEWTDPKTGTIYEFISGQIFGTLNKYKRNPRLVVYVDEDSGYEDYYVDLDSQPPMKR